MKTITIKQPWASLIVEGVKDIENRTWKTNFRGRVLIHAADKSWIWHKVLNYITPKMKEVFVNNRLTGKWLRELTTGSIIGSVEIVDCVINHSSVWAESTTVRHMGDNVSFVDGDAVYNWVLANPIKFPEPIPIKGRLGFWDYPNILAEPEEKNGELFCHCQLPVKEINQVTGDSSFGYYCRYCGGKWYK